MRLRSNLIPATLILSILQGAVAARAGSINLWGVADGDTIYIEEQSDAFFRMDLYDPPPRETQQRFHSITDPNITFGSLAFDGFPNDDDFRLGSVEYDEAGLVGGTGLAPITGLTLGVGTDPADPSHVNYSRWAPTNTYVDDFDGTVSLSGGVVTAIDLTSDVHLEINPVGEIFLNAPGTFSISGDRFEGYMEVSTGGPNTKLIWDFSGTLTTVAVPEPSTLLLGLAGAWALLIVRRR